MKEKKVFFVMNRLGGIGWGGAHRVAVIIANYLSNKGYDVNIIVWNKIRVDYPIDRKVNVIDLKIEQKSEIDRIKACLQTRKILKNYKGAYVYALMSRIAVDVFLISPFLKLHIIASERTNPYIEPHNKFFRLLRNIFFCFMYKTVYQTPEALQYFPKMARKKGVVIPNPLSHNLIKPYRGEDRKKEFVTYCRIDKQKNLPMMIDAFIEVHNKHSEFILKIYGNGLLENEIKNYILSKKAEKFIFMCDFEKNIHEKIIESFAYLNTSYYEGLSNSMLEAMAIGLPCICTDCPIGGSRMVIENNKNGILVPTNDVKALVTEMNYLIENPLLAKKLSDNAIKIRNILSEDKICQIWENLMYERSK